MPKYTDEKLVSVLSEAIQGSENFANTTLSKERSEVQSYYRGELPKPFHVGDSKYVSMDVFDGVEAMKATVLETFSAHQRIVYFKPEGPEDTEGCRIATDYASYSVFRSNDGEGVFGDVLTDGLMNRYGVAKVYTEYQDQDEEEEFTGLTEDELAAYLAERGTDVEVTDLEQDGQLYSGKITVKAGSKKIKIDSIPSEDFLVAKRAVSIANAKWCAHRCRKMIGTLKEEYSLTEEQVEELTRGADNDITSRVEREERFSPVENNLFEEDEYSSETREVDVYEIYIKLALEEGQVIPRLWKICMAGNMILDKQRIRRKPFAIFVPLPVPHTFFGNNFAKLLIPTQNARTVLFRQIINHSVTTNNPRWTVLNGAVPNPSELMDNRLGGLVNVRRQDAVVPLMQPPLNPFAFNVIQLLDEDKEEVTGISKLSQGLNKDAVSSQNSQGMVEQLISASQQRQKIIARQFGRFVRDVYLLVYDLAVTEIDKQEIVDVAGNWVEVNPKTWIERKDASIELSLGYGEMEREGMRWIEVDQYLANDPQLAPAYGPEQRYEVLRRAMRKRGIEDVENILIPPEKRPPQEPSPAEQIQMAQAQAQIELTKAQAQASVMKAQTDQMRAQMELMKIKAELGVSAEELNIKKQEFQHEKAMDLIEAQLAKETEDKRAIIAMDS